MMRNNFCAADTGACGGARNKSERITAPSGFLGGVLCIKKPQGCSSHDVVFRIRRLFGTSQVGHTGTLDPMATGALVVMVGRAVKASEFLMCDSKAYTAGIRLGITTDTEDTEGETLTRYEGELPRISDVRAAAERLTGRIMQTPPMYSALKVGGKKLVDLARRGIEVERQAREVEIFSIDAEETEEPSVFRLKVRCSKGTYIRTLCADMGRLLGCGAAMCSLERTESGSFSLEDGYTLEQIEGMTVEERYALLCPVEKLFSELPEIKLSEFFAHLGHSGCELYQKKLRTELPVGRRARLSDGEGFFALAEVREYPDGTALKPIKQFRI